MPQTARMIVQLRQQQGRDRADWLVRCALAGEPGLFWNAENYLSFGTPPVTNHICHWGEQDRLVRCADPPWMLKAAEFVKTLGYEVNVVDVTNFDEALQRAERLRTILRKVSYATEESSESGKRAA
ncbi:hypothetical protein GCM10010946_34610 [Undibacterium squillarum]|uniref:Uncharacterized protein n=2 Tax=Undibacterium squillarum TaxID=1131567 RepID=A0ABQ2Y2K4_9BURK|nr:hypothetical protein GCM10010946_34610 [Undibacterium squillarum]